MNSLIHTFAFLLSILSMLSICGLAQAAEDLPVKNILVLHSYNHGYLWTDEETDGINSVLNKQGNGIELHITYMDAKRLRTKETDEILRQLLAVKMDFLHFAGVIAVDNDAFDFVRTNRKGLFKDIPVVFCGINNFSPEMLADWPECTGVVENQDYKGSCEIGLELFPSANCVFVISDDTLTGREHFEGVKKIEPQLPGIKFTYWNFSAYPISETLAMVSSLSPKNIILLLSFFKDGNGVVYSMDDAISQISGSAEVPIFTSNNTRIMHGVLGGKILTGFDQGAIGAQLMRKILRGTPVSEIPVNMNPPHRFAFDYSAIERFGIPHSFLPSGSLILNRPPTFYSVNKPLFFTVILVFVLLLALVSVLAIGLTHKKRNVKALKESEEKFRALFEQAAVGVGMADVEGNFIRVNRKYAEMFGYSQMDMRGMNLKNLTHPDSIKEDAEQTRKLLDRSLADMTVEKKYLHKNGETVWALLNLSLLRLKDGKEIYQIAIVQDITEKKKLEEQLIRSEKLSAVGQLVAGIAHEFNNVLMILKGNIELAAMGMLDETEIKDMYSVLDKQVDKGRDIVSKIMSFARPKPAKKELFKLKAMIYEVISLQVEQMRLENISPEMDVPEDLEICVDRDQLQQILVNMFLNSRHAIIPKGSGKIKISAVRRDNEIIIKVSDNGIGMNEETKKMIFTPFFTTKRASPVNHMNIKGSGLGLSVCNNIVQMHGGRITFESQEGSGTTFTIYLPCAWDKISEASKNDDSSMKIDFSNIKIFVVDDEPDICRPLSKMLTYFGCSRHGTSTSPFEAVKIINSNPPDLLFLDMLMPGMSGIQLVEHLDNRGKGIFIVLMSGKLDVDIEDLQEDYGVAAFLQKPFSKDMVLDVLKMARTAIINKGRDPAKV